MMRELLALGLIGLAGYYFVTHASNQKEQMEGGGVGFRIVKKGYVLLPSKKKTESTQPIIYNINLPKAPELPKPEIVSLPITQTATPKKNFIPVTSETSVDIVKKFSVSEEHYKLQKELQMSFAPQVIPQMKKKVESTPYLKTKVELERELEKGREVFIKGKKEMSLEEARKLYAGV